MAGHSKWTQIKHKKALTDARKSQLFSKLARLITVAAKEKGQNPETNSKLRMAIEKARSLAMPQINIERAIEKARGQETGEGFSEALYEAYGPGGSALLISAITDNKNRTAAEIKHLLGEYGGRLGEKGSVAWIFEQKFAYDIIPPKEGNPDEFELALIDEGAEDMEKQPEQWTVYPSRDGAEKVKSAIIQRGGNVKEEYIDWVPKNKVTTDSETKKKLEGLLTKLDDHDDVQEVYTNVTE